MDFEDTPEEAAFRAEARSWLEAHASLRTERARRPSDDEHVRRCKEWQRMLYDGGWAGITWPKEWGGRGGTSMQQSIFNEEQARFDVATGIFAVGIGMVGPTLIAHGTDAQKEQHLGPLLRGEEVWCQLFSEPGAGSDLANLSTRAVRDGDDFVVNGQKVWTSMAHFADHGILLTRTDPDQPKHRGITYLLVDMRSPGVEVRPLRQINGEAHFNEVFLDDVRVPGDNLVGEVNGGWGVALTTMAHERTTISGGGVGPEFGDVLELARQFGRDKDPLARQRLADAYIRFELLRFLRLRLQTAVSQGRMPGPESSVMKLAYSQHLAALGDDGLALEGAAGMLGGGLWEQQFLNQWAARIGGGTDQVQRNVVGERSLGLPREPRLDKDTPWRSSF